MSNEEEWTYLTDAFNEIEADIICGLLESENIPVKKEYNGPYPGLKVILGQESGFSIMVPAAYRQRARDLLANQEEENSG